MSDHTQEPQTLAAGGEPRYDDLVEEIAERIETGEPLDLEAYLARYPQCADRLRRVVPAMQAMVELGMDAASGGARRRGPASIGGTLGDYRIEREIARGGMGVVYEAEQISLGRRVALKVLPFSGLLEDRQRQRFQNEARAAATLEHPHIVPIYGIGPQRGVHYYAMKLIQGHSFAELLAEMRQEAPAAGGAPPAGGSLSELAERLSSGRFSAEFAGGDVAQPTLAPEYWWPASTGTSFGRRITPAPRAVDRAVGAGDRLPPHDCAARCASGRCARLRTSAGHHASRCQTRQPPAGCRRQLLDHRFRFGSDRERRDADAHRRSRRYAPLHESGTSPRRAGTGRQPRRHLRPWRDALRDAHPAAGVSRRRSVAADLCHPRRRSPRPTADGFVHPARSGDDRPEGDRKIPASVTDRPAHSPPICSGSSSTNRSGRADRTFSIGRRSGANVTTMW